MTYLTHDIPVHGGELRVGEWRPDVSNVSDAPTIVALHGITGSHRAWAFLAAALPGVRVIAPDLRGRGRSSGLPAPYGVRQHTNDVLAVVDAMGIRSAVVLGHSMGAFVATSAMQARPQVFTQGVLLDGGLPVTVALELSDRDLVEAVLGQVGRRFDFAFASLESNRRFWQLHPAFAAAWNDTLSAYADYDVEETIGDAGQFEFRSMASREAITADARELYGSTRFRAALCSLSQPVTVMSASRGLLNESPGVYSPRERAAWQAELPQLRLVEVADVNHYTLVLSARGASAIAAELARSGALSSPTGASQPNRQRQSR